MRSWLQQWYGVDHAPEVKDGGAMARLASLSGAEFEITFMQMMIRHHRKAVREGLACIDRAEHPELIALCQNIVETQRQEIQQMEAWLCQWYGVGC